MKKMMHAFFVSSAFCSSDKTGNDFLEGVEVIEHELWRTRFGGIVNWVVLVLLLLFIYVPSFKTVKVNDTLGLERIESFHHIIETNIIHPILHGGAMTELKVRNPLTYHA